MMLEHIQFHLVQKMKVHDGDMVEVAQPLIEGSINPAEILAIKGPEGVYEYLISEVQKVYRNQGVDINDKHIEVIGRQMLKKVKLMIMVIQICFQVH